ncbi:MAG: phage tail protein [Lachnospiraceae bacterium]|nr:phage tail protein [Lachnospiraceae bacterium]
MGNTVSNVTTGKPKTGGAVFWAPLGTTIPTDTTTALDKAFVCMGYCSDDGVSNSAAPDTDEVKAWGGDTVLRTNKGRKDSFKFTMLEAKNPDVLKRVYNSTNVTGDLKAGLTVKVNSEDPEEGIWVIDEILRGNTAKRTVIPDGQVTDLGDVESKDGDPIGYEVTVAASPDASGNTHYEYLKDPSTT